MIRTRGSEWRKWDLHLHAPGTKQNDQYALPSGVDVLDEYCRRLHESDVQAFGITDYFSADSYFAISRKYQERYPDSKKAFFPNIELRTNDVVNAEQEEVNIHLIFNTFRTDFDNKLRSFLTLLKTNKTDASRRQIPASELRLQSDYFEATTTRAFIWEALEETYGKGADLLDCVLIVTAANNDGIRPMRGKKRKLLITDELDKFSDAFFGNASNTAYFLRSDRAEDNLEHTKPKPVLSGCDAHSFADLDERLGQVVSDPSEGIVYEPTWIKADLTFEGLKQIVFEPANRVFIGTEPEIERRVRENKTRYIESLRIDRVEGYRQDQHGSWFRKEMIELGKELVAIIGNKGSGKSAVTDIIGLLGNSHNQMSKGFSGTKPEELFSFLNKEKFLKAGCARYFEGVLQWYEGEPDRKLLDATVAMHLPEKIEYLPQKYLERICSNIADDEFRATLNEVIFRYVKLQDQHGKRSLDELIQYLTLQAQEDIAKKKHELHQINTAVVVVEKKLTEDYRRELEEKIRLKSEDLDAHAKAKPERKRNPEPSEDSPSKESTQVDNLSKQIEAIADQITQLENEQVDVSAATEELKQVRQAIVREVSALRGLEAKYRITLAAAGISFDEIVQLTVNYTTLDTAISTRLQRLNEINVQLLTKDDINEMYSSDDDANGAAVAHSLVCQKATLELERAEIIERLSKPAREYQQYLNELNHWTDRERELRGDDKNPGAETLKGLEKELGNINTLYPEKLRAAKAEQERISKEIFSKKLGLTEFYNAVKRSIDEVISKSREHLGEYDISIEAGLRLNTSFVDDFLKFINQGAVGSFRGQEEGRAMLRRLIEVVTDWEDEQQVFSMLSSIVEALHKDNREDVSPLNATRDVFKQMKSQKSVEDLFDYMVLR